MYYVTGNAVKCLCFLSCLLIIDAKRRDRYDLIEKRMSVVESRVSVDNLLAKEMFVSLQQNFDELNTSMINFKDQMCPIMDQQAGREKQTDSAKRVELLKSSQIQVSLGLNREKQWTRDQLGKLTSLVNEQNGLNQNFSELINELKVGKDEMEVNLEMMNAKLDAKIQSKLSKLDEIITNNDKEVNDKVDLKFNRTYMIISSQQKEIEALKETQTTIFSALLSANIVSYKCPLNWKQYSLYCYLFANETSNFYNARVHCKQLGATLASIENHEENSFVKKEQNSFVKKEHSLKRPLYFLGYTDEEEEGIWISERTGLPASFTNFGDGYPNGGTRRNCILFISGDWFDVGCQGDHYFICIKDASIVFN